jgi:hypothetical protein
MEVTLPKPVKAQYMQDLPPEGSAPPGAFTFYVNFQETRIAGMIYCCPCGCGRHGALAFRPLSEDDIKYSRHGWNWDGNKESPTLNPSIHHVGHWHGWLKNGFFTQA